MTSTTWYLILVTAVGLERVAELIVSKRNIQWSLARGGVEYGARHYPVMVVLHSALLVGCVVETLGADREFHPWLGWPMLALVVASQGLRWWCIRTLGPRWNTKIVVVPSLPLVTGGPYRWFRHPNYVAVVVEGFALPLVHGNWLTALAFTVLNAALLSRRITLENRALATVSAS